MEPFSETLVVPYDDRGSVTMECLSCGHELTDDSRKNVPSSVECCRHCWQKVSIADRLRISLATRDRCPGGVLSELADVLTRTVEFQQRNDIE